MRRSVKRKLILVAGILLSAYVLKIILTAIIHRVPRGRPSLFPRPAVMSDGIEIKKELEYINELIETAIKNDATFRRYLTKDALPDLIPSSYNNLHFNDVVIRVQGIQSRTSSGRGNPMTPLNSAVQWFYDHQREMEAIVSNRAMYHFNQASKIVAGSLERIRSVASASLSCYNYLISDHFDARHFDQQLLLLRNKVDEFMEMDEAANLRQALKELNSFKLAV